MATKPKAQIIKRTAWGSAAEALALMIIGLLFVIWPDTMVKILAYVIGTFFVVKGAYNIAMYYTEKGQQDFFNNKLLSGIVAVLVGVVAFVVGENIASVSRVIIGVIIIYESLVRINTASKLSTLGIDSWRSVLLLALIMLALGLFITFNTGAVVTLIGALMIAAGIIGIVGDIMFIQHVNTIIDKLTKK
ncbi:DUF308 domain-containing protein [Candidatus Saccharibacteria bacterium]|nr:DUF308 domain-containing protein [Candidatus Saccharibacteria bacterium]